MKIQYSLSAWIHVWAVSCAVCYCHLCSKMLDSGVHRVEFNMRSYHFRYFYWHQALQEFITSKFMHFISVKSTGFRKWRIGFGGMSAFTLQLEDLDKYETTSYVGRNKPVSCLLPSKEKGSLKASEFIYLVLCICPIF